MTLHFEQPRAARSGVALFPIVLALAGCAATITQDGVEQRTSIAIGRPAGSFTIANQTEGSAGRIDYSVKTKDGKTFNCYMYSATGFQRAMSFGQTPHSDAVCIVQAGASAVAAPCSALEKAAGRWQLGKRCRAHGQCAATASLGRLGPTQPQKQSMNPRHVAPPDA